MGKNAKNATFFSKERKRTQECCILLKRTSAQPWYLPVGIHVLHHILCLLLVLPKWIHIPHIHVRVFTCRHPRTPPHTLPSPAPPLSWSCRPVSPGTSCHVFKRGVRLLNTVEWAKFFGVIFSIFEMEQVVLNLLVVMYVQKN